ncbi:FecCD family ABC transporter permease [Dietzia psychralcaliphila]|uniref:FecCD family ABC transporter permease n=1 Tax=Dietzia psychralcaliphila TaxID=139021 RepID=UPI001C1DFC30|nr:iron chelate uptake ABC transporter family permease subunit [Dietzia psychralcaliphila]
MAVRPTSRNPAVPPGAPGRSRRHRRGEVAAGLALALVALALAVVASLAIGARSIPPGEVIEALLGRGSLSVVGIVGELRVNRTVLGLVCGAALGASGALMQAVTRNPIADPGILGVNAGAALGVVVGAVVTGGLGLTSTVWFALAGAGIASAVILVLSASPMAASSPVRLTLAGVALAAVLSGISQAIVVLDEEILDSYRYWQVGSLTARPVDEVLGVVPLVVVGAVIALLLLRGLDAIALGDDSAIALGVHPGWVRAWSLVAVALLAGTATALAGPIGFVGLIIPHLARGLVGPSLRRVVPLSMVLAPALLLVADVIGRVIGGGAETPAGVVTAFIGAPLLIGYLVFGRRVGAA